jgi:crotonobetainyl-CoA:carnitine CoA-transferase CaiB-like acyl-CoA transferase
MRPLEGITVVALEQAVAAPIATRHLADLGARVLKVERPDGGDFARAYDDKVKGLASHFVWLNRSKESVTLDIKTDGGRRVLADLVARADVFLQNLAPGALARLGFDSAGLRQRHPLLITCDMSGYGSAGPYRDKRAYDLLVQCETALVAVTGPPEQPAKTGVPAADIAAGMYAYSSILAALFARERTGEGTAIEVSMFDSLAEWMGYQLYATRYSGVAPPRSGLSHPTIAPYDAYETADGHSVVLGIQNDREWVRLAEGALPRPALATAPGFATSRARVANRARTDAVVAKALKTLTAQEAVRRLDAAQIASARLNTVEEFLDHPQLAARHRWREVDTPAGPIQGLLPVPVMSGVEMRMDPVPVLGEHTDAVLRELGYDDERIRALHEEQAV